MNPILAQKKIASALLKLKSTVRPDWIDPKDMTVPALKALLDLAIASRNWKMIVAVYAAMIILDRRNNPEAAVPWVQIAEQLQKRFWFMPNAMAVLKRHAWAHIYAAKARQTAHGVAIRPTPDLQPSRELPAFWRLLGAVLSNAVAAGLALVGLLIVARIFWSAIFWAFHPELTQMELWYRTWGSLKDWGI
jgi:hypothetical protein